MRILIFIFSLVALLSVSTFAQNGKYNNTPVWAISKGVQQLQFRDVEFLPAKITTTSRMIGIKDVHSRSQKAEIKGVVTMTGYPSWTITKGVARFQYEGASKK